MMQEYNIYDLSIESIEDALKSEESVPTSRIVEILSRSLMEYYVAHTEQKLVSNFATPQEMLIPPNPANTSIISNVIFSVDFRCANEPIRELPDTLKEYSVNNLLHYMAQFITSAKLGRIPLGAVKWLAENKFLENINKKLLSELETADLELKIPVPDQWMVAFKPEEEPAITAADLEESILSLADKWPGITLYTLIAQAKEHKKHQGLNFMLQKLEQKVSSLGDKEPDNINPTHYTWHPVCECRMISQEFDSNIGQAIQYLWRYKHHHAGPIDNLKKAKRFIEFEIERQKGLGN